MINGTFLITGVTSGMGLKIAKRLVGKGAHHIITGVRDRTRANKLRNAIPSERLTVLDLDLGSLRSASDFSEQVKSTLSSRNEKLAGIVCNAGMQTIGPRIITADGFEVTFQVNYLGHFLITHALLPSLEAEGKVVTIGSGTYNPEDPVARRGGFRGAFFPGAKCVSVGDLGTKGTDLDLGQDRYATSKLCAILFVREMAKRISDNEVRFYCFDPGLMPGTDLGRERGRVVQFVFKNVLPALVPFISLISSPEKSAAMLVDHILGGEKYSSGDYIEFTGNLAPLSPLAENDNHADELYRVSQQLIVERTEAAHG